MKIKQLIEILQAYPDSLDVFVDGYENGQESLDPRKVEILFVVKDLDPRSYNGTHHVVPACETLAKGRRRKKVLNLGRSSC